MYKVHTSCPASASVWYIPISLCVWPHSSRRGQALFCYLICPNSFLCLASSAGCGQARSGAILLSNVSQFLYASGQQRQAQSGAILLSNVSQFLYASGQGQSWSGAIMLSDMSQFLYTYGQQRQVLPKNIVNLLLTSDHIIISCFPQPSCQHYFYWTSKLTNSPS